MEVLGALVGSFVLRIVAKLLCFCLFGIVELYAMNVFNDFLIGKWELVLCEIKAYLIHDL